MHGNVTRLFSTFQLSIAENIKLPSHFYAKSQKKVITLRLGLEGLPLSAEEVATRTGLSLQKVLTVQRNACRKLLHPVRSRQLQKGTLKKLEAMRDEEKKK